MTHVIAVVNQKGGVGKTTSTINLGAQLAKNGYKVLIVDADPQGNATTGSGVDKNNIKFSTYDVLINGEDVSSCIVIIPNPAILTPCTE